MHLHFALAQLVHALPYGAGTPFGVTAVPLLPWASIADTVDEGRVLLT